MTDTKPPSAETKHFYDVHLHHLLRHIGVEKQQIVIATLDVFAEQRAAEAKRAAGEEARREGHNERCYYCGEPCNDLAGDPGEWSIGLSHPDELGLVKYHHTRCIFVRLHPDPLVTAEDKARRAAIRECANAVAWAIHDAGLPADSDPALNLRCREIMAHAAVGAIRALADKPAAGKGGL